MDEFVMDMKQLARKLLKDDILYDKIPKKERIEFINYAIKQGYNAADDSLNDGLNKENPKKYIQKKVRVNYKKESPPVPIFSEAKLKNRIINLYTEDIDKGITDSIKIKPEKINFEKAYDVFLLHEYYHILEEKNSKYKTNKKEIVVFEILKWKIKRSIKMLSEISAHAYVRKITGLPIDYIKKTT
ncbi:MAG: hypothetical protein ACOCUD_02955 [Bacillota bacterium]